MAKASKGLIVVLVIDELQIDEKASTIARVCRDYDVDNVEQLRVEIAEAAASAAGQVHAGLGRLEASIALAS